MSEEQISVVVYVKIDDDNHDDIVERIIHLSLLKVHPIDCAVRSNELKYYGYVHQNELLSIRKFNLKR